jgi:hypothetical protein
MNTKTEGSLAIVAAMFVLFSAMWDARISAGIAIVVLIGAGCYKLLSR